MDRSELKRLWSDLYPGEEEVFGDLSAFLEAARDAMRGAAASSAAAGASGAAADPVPELPFDCDGSVYCLYPDAFGGGLDGATARMDYFAELGAKTLWVLPVLRSPGRDQGFDISDYRAVDERFGGNEAFARFLAAARGRGLQTIFDVAVNHCSDAHPWFLDAVSDPASPYRDFFIWSDDDRRYAKAPLVFRGMVDSNWTWSEAAGAYYFHRFYPFQPDLNYANPRVAAEMIKILAEWKLKGVGGFRMDAAVMLWKREGTDCESLPEVHKILRIFRACLDVLSPGTLLLAEANQSVPGLLPYFGKGDECRAAYHFPLMPRLWQALAEESPRRLTEVDIPPLPEGCAWFTFLRVHDEVTLDVIPAAERRALVEAFAGSGQRLFRGGDAFSGRLFDLLGRNPERAVLAFALLLALPGTPVLYYGDEIGMVDNAEYFERTAAATGFRDSRFLNRGPFDETRAAAAVSDPSTPEGRVYRAVGSLFRLRAKETALFLERPRLRVDGPVLISTREKDGRRLEIKCNLAGREARSLTRRFRGYESLWEIIEE